MMIDAEFTPLEKAKIVQAKTMLCENLKRRFESLGFPFDVREMFVSGGCIASLLQNETPKDFDVYFKSQSSANRVDSFCKLNSGFVEDVNENYRDTTPNNSGKLFTENAITMKNGLQFITKHVGSPKEIRDTFDFVHCKPYYDFEEDLLYISKQQYLACVDKKLIINNHNTVTEHRIQKFIQKGYRQ